MIESLIDLRNTEKGRWYRLEVGSDLFGQKVLIKRWGSLHSRHGSHSTVPIVPGLDTIKLLKTELRRRTRRGYC
jgi:hypothetical protein